MSATHPTTCQATVTADHMRQAHGWTIYASEENDQATLNAMHRCALENAAATPDCSWCNRPGADANLGGQPIHAACITEAEGIYHGIADALGAHTHHEGPVCGHADDGDYHGELEAPGQEDEPCRHYTCQALTREICYPCEAEAAAHEEAGEALCPTHGWQAITHTGSFTGYAGGTCYVATLACGCGGVDESADIRAAF